MKAVFIRLWLPILLAGCAQTPDNYEVLYGISSNQQFLKKLLILPADITIQERFPGDLYEDIPLWANEVNHGVVSQLANTIDEKIGLETIAYQEIEKSTAVEHHVPLIKSVARAVRMHSRGFDLWPHKMERFDYTIGTGMNVLKTGNIDAVLFVGGYQSVEIFRYDDSKASIYTYRKQDLSLGDLYLTLILIDTNSGDLVWTYFGTFSNIDLRNNTEVQTVLAHALVRFPINVLDI